MQERPLKIGRGEQGGGGWGWRRGVSTRARRSQTQDQARVVRLQERIENGLKWTSRRNQQSANKTSSINAPARKSPSNNHTNRLVVPNPITCQDVRTNVGRAFFVWHGLVSFHHEPTLLRWQALRSLLLTLDVDLRRSRRPNLWPNLFGIELNSTTIRYSLFLDFIENTIYLA